MNKRIISKIKELYDFFSDRKVLIGIGTGIIIGTIAMTGVKMEARMTKVQIEEKARQMGMDYPDNIKVLYDKGVSK